MTTIYALSFAVPATDHSPFMFGYVHPQAYRTKEAAIARLLKEYDTIEQIEVTNPSTAWIVKCTRNLFGYTFTQTYTVFEVTLED